MMEWQRHNGRGMPCEPDRLVYFGIRANPKARAVTPPPTKAGGLIWDHRDSPGDIIWWRPA